MTLADWLIYGTDWRWQMAGGLALLAGLGVVAVRLFGLSAGLKMLAALGAVLAALAYGRRERQQGWSDAHAKGDRDAQDAIRKADRARAGAERRDADALGLRDHDDGYRRD